MMRWMGRCGMAAACRRKVGGVIINEHLLTAAQARAHVGLLSQWFDFIHHDDLADRLLDPGRRPFCLLTFDDGKRSNATETAPELERLGVPAVFYVVTRFLSEGAPLWFDWQAALVRRLGAPPPGLSPEELKQLPLSLAETRLKEACAKHGVTLDLRDDNIRPMSWDEARGLSRRGFTIGAHSTRHAILTREPEAAALADISASLHDVSQELGTPCQTFAFPNGNYTARLAKHAIARGARTVMTTEPMWAGRDFPLWRLPRIQLSGRLPLARMEQKIALAATGRILKNPDGTGRLYRRVHNLPDHRRSELPSPGWGSPLR